MGIVGTGKRTVTGGTWPPYRLPFVPAAAGGQALVAMRLITLIKCEARP